MFRLIAWGTTLGWAGDRLSFSCLFQCEQPDHDLTSAGNQFLAHSSRAPVHCSTPVAAAVTKTAPDPTSAVPPIWSASGLRPRDPNSHSADPNTTGPERIHMRLHASSAARSERHSLRPTQPTTNMKDPNNSMSSAMTIAPALSF